MNKICFLPPETGGTNVVCYWRLVTAVVPMPVSGEMLVRFPRERNEATRTEAVSDAKVLIETIYAGMPNE